MKVRVEIWRLHWRAGGGLTSYAWKFASALFKCHEMENVAMEEGEDAVGGGWMGRKPITAS